MRLHLTILCCLALLPACTWERTVYDEYGNRVEDSAPGQEKSLEEVMNSRFDASFSQRRNKDGVPESTSDRVSSFQRDIDEARTGGKTFHTNEYGGFSKSSDFHNKSFKDAGKSFDGNKAFGDAGKSSSSFSRDLRPDFLNESHGLAHTDYQGPLGTSQWDGKSSSANGRTYDGTHASQYKAHTPSTYAESRQSKTPQPKIIDHRDQGKPTIDETRHLLGRDEKPE